MSARAASGPATSARLTGLGIAQRMVPAAGSGRFRRGRRMVSTSASAVLVAAIFGFALPHFASYRSVWASVERMTWPQARHYHRNVKFSVTLGAAGDGRDPAALAGLAALAEA